MAPVTVAAACPVLSPMAPSLPPLAALATASRLHVLTADGEVLEGPFDDAAGLITAPVLVCHGAQWRQRTGVDTIPVFDLLELLAFTHPCRFAVPSVDGVAAACGLAPPRTTGDRLMALTAAAQHLLADLADGRGDRHSDAVGIAFHLGGQGWPWAPAVLRALGAPDGRGSPPAAALKVWHHLPEWQAEAPRPPPGTTPVAPADAVGRLRVLRGAAAEARPEQERYSEVLTNAFLPRDSSEEVHLVLAEAGTGTGKTLGYLAPASLWAERNGGTVWLSTYTRNLQHQVDGEIDRLYADAATRRRKAVVRKGRENYLCLLNLEEAMNAAAAGARSWAVGLGLMARWVAATRDGDLTGSDFPGWLPDLIGRAASFGLADRRGECIYSACPHYNRCFVEQSVRRARRADLVVANHALVLTQAALGGGEDGQAPQRYVFDEGHHLFDAADSTFAAHLTAGETAELRRWLLGSEIGRRAGRARGLARRVEDLILDDAEAVEALADAVAAAGILPAPGWQHRLAGDPVGPAERYFSLIQRQVYARAAHTDGPFDLEVPATGPVPGLAGAAGALADALGALTAPLRRLGGCLRQRLTGDAQERLDAAQRSRIDAMVRGLDRRVEHQLRSWTEMLSGIGQDTDPTVVEWFGVARGGGDGSGVRDIDVGHYRHWLDPTVPLAGVIAGTAHGVVVTSATLGDRTDTGEPDWAVAEARTGATYLPGPITRLSEPSPFDYAGQTRVLVVRDVRKDDLDQVAAAYRGLFTAAGGGALGLFTAIARLKAVHRRIAPALDAAGLPLLAQHVDGLSVATLVDIFRQADDACLLGTDAVRDGVDVPGRSLRLIVFDRVPWPRPSILHKARREAFGGRAYDDRLTRLRLAQAFGRLVRRADDRGVFVMLDPMMPSRLAVAFPPGVTVERVGLAEAIAVVRTFMDPAGTP